MSTLLVWQVEGHLGLSKTTLGMVRGESFAVVLMTTSGGGYDHRSQGFDTPEEAEAYLLSETDYAGGKMLLPPTEIEVSAPSAVHVDSNDFKSWVDQVFLGAVMREAVVQSLRGVTLKFGKLEQAFTR